jgi:hypothetical protein
MVHYNTQEDIDKLINALKTLTFWKNMMKVMGFEPISVPL